MSALASHRRPGISSPRHTCSRSHRRVIIAGASQPERTAKLRQLLQRPGILLGPACYDGISARLTEQAGFDFAFMSGFCVAGGRLGYPDTGLISYAEMLDQGRNMHEATNSIPIIGDGDTGYGNAMNVQRTVQGYASAGFAGILIEDQVWPKSCGHVRGKRVVPREEAIARIKAAVDARNAGQDIVIVARTDARQAVSYEEALYRAAAFADMGADVVFVDALESEKEMRTLCSQVTNAYKMANMLEGGGKTPILSPEELDRMGFKLCAYPLSLLGVSITAMQRALVDLKSGKISPDVPSFGDLQSVVGFPQYFEQEAKYAVGGDDLSTGSSNSAAAAVKEPVQQQQQQEKQPVAASKEPARPIVVEADEVVEPGSSRSSNSSSKSEGTVDMITSSKDDEYKRSEDRRAQFLRIVISNTSTKQVNLDTRFPAGFLNAASFIPQVAGVDLEGLLKQTKGGDWKPEEPLLEFSEGSDRIQIFLEFS